MKNLTLTAFVVLAAFSLNSANAELLDFTGWDHSLVSGGGQTFNDIVGDVDVTVTTFGAFDADSTFLNTGAGGYAIRSLHDNPGSHSFIFHFSEPLDIYVATTFVDQNEEIGVYAQGDEHYLNESGNLPVVTMDGSGMRLAGTGFGAQSSTGKTFAGPTSVLTVSYKSNSPTDTKYLDFNIGTVVPEPGTLGLFAIGSLVLLGRRRRK